MRPSWAGARFGGARSHLRADMGRDTNFYYSFLVLPPDKRRAIIAVWDFCRAVDDAVDEAGAGEPARSQVARWRTELATVFDGGHPQTSQGRMLAPLVKPFHLPRDAFEALIEGVEMDLDSRRYESFADLYEYCIRVASAIGLICLEIFGYVDPRSRQYATDLGVALQLTNILRDIPGDLAQGRVYVPLEDFERYGCGEDDLQKEAVNAGRGVQSAAVKRLLASQAQRARDYFARARAALPREDGRSLVAAEIMGAIYRSILTRIEASDYDVFSRVIRVPRPQRALIAGTVWLRVATLGH
jgi:15-cis-phytoene synthase